MYRQQAGKPETKAIILDADDLIEFSYEYFFNHPDFDNPSINQESHYESTPTVVCPDLHEESSSNSPSSNENPVSTENVNNLESVNGVPETLPSQNVFKNETYSQFLSELYYSNKEFMDKEFEEITHNETFNFYGDNILQRFSIPKNIACLVLLKKQQLMEYDVKIKK
uniref:Uncharacterized protein n=1 Tax=Panagrolaimus sp. PS1159 TaxID=55785 RepID=A0AC35FHL8_9BILA